MTPAQLEEYASHTLARANRVRGNVARLARELSEVEQPADVSIALHDLATQMIELAGLNAAVDALATALDVVEGGGS